MSDKLFYIGSKFKIHILHLSPFPFINIISSSGHPKRAMVTIFWVFCPMIVKLFLDIVKWAKEFYINGFSLYLCGCKDCKVSKNHYFPVVYTMPIAITQKFCVQGNDSFWVKWIRFSINGSFWVHLPILQPFVHFTFLIESGRFI